MKSLTQDFCFEYLGGGWFREKGVAKGTPADMLHGAEALEAFAWFLALKYQWEAEADDV